ncbi:hypothetical protein KLP28_08685 [Nocardioidaceae bacterium]|nr:hypothetical protein KLP28_08685 [Nocardioidaceae bacterium]
MTPAPTTVATLVAPAELTDLLRALRAATASFDDTAWVRPAPGETGSGLATLSQDLLDALGAVGLSRPRAVGERHLLRPLVHLIHGPVRHLVVEGAQALSVETLAELHQTAILGDLSLWLLLDPTSVFTGPAPQERHRTSLLRWLDGAAEVIPSHEVLDQWSRRAGSELCAVPSLSWWTEPLRRDRELHPCPAHRHLADCLMSWGRRGLSLGQTSPTLHRQRLVEWAHRPTASVIDRWHLTAAGRDFYTPGMDALAYVAPTAADLLVRDVAPDGATVHVEGQDVPVPAERRDAVARLRTSRRVAGCHPLEPIRGIFDSVQDKRPRRR